MLDPTYLSDISFANAYWRNREHKKWRLDVTAGPVKRPTFQRTYYAGGRDREAAQRTFRAHTRGLIPHHARVAIRLAGPCELGCVPTGGPGAA